MIVLFENSRKEHPLDNIAVGLELEFAVSMDTDDFLSRIGYEEDEEDEEEFEDTISSIFSEFVNEVADQYEGKIEETFREVFGENIKVAGLQNGTEYDSWRYERDSSIDHADRYEVHIGFELISPVLTAENGQELERKLRNILEKFDEFIRSHPDFFTTDRCGLHVNISSTKEEMTPIQKIALLYLFDTSRFIDKRETRGKFAKKASDAMSEVIKMPKQYWKNFIKAYTDKDQNLIKSFLEDFDRLTSLKDKPFYASTLPRKNRVEFRAIGGDFYERRIDEIIEKIKKFAAYFKASSNRNIERRVRKIVVKILSKILEELKSGKRTKAVPDYIRRALGINEDILLDTALRRFGEKDYFLSMLKYFRELLTSGSAPTLKKHAYSILRKIVEIEPKYAKYRKAIESFEDRIKKEIEN